MVYGGGIQMRSGYFNAAYSIHICVPRNWIPCEELPCDSDYFFQAVYELAVKTPSVI